MRPLISKTVFVVSALIGQCVFAEQQDIKVFRVGSSSFSYTLIENTRAIVESLGEFRLLCDRKMDQAGYTRLDQFLTQPGLLEEWCERTIPRIEAGEYDFVIIQTIGWLKFEPADQERLCRQIIPELVRRIRSTGAEVILYDKYIPVQLRQKDPRAKQWCMRYPEGYRLNYLLHVLAARHAGIAKISFGGQAVSELWAQPPFSELGFLYCDSSHPGPMANHLSALNLAHLLTGLDPKTAMVRDVPMGAGRRTAFEKLASSDRPADRELYDSNKQRIHGERLTLSEAEAKWLQDAAAKSFHRWNTILHENLHDENAFAGSLMEIQRIQKEMDRFEEHGLDQQTAVALRASFAAAENPDDLAPQLIGKIRRKSRSIDYASTEVRGYLNRFLTREKQRDVRKQFEEYWSTNNSKLRDDIYFHCRVEEEKALRDGRRDDARKYGSAANMIRYVFSFPAFQILIESLNSDQRSEVLSNYSITGPRKRHSPGFAAYQNEHHFNQDKLFDAWEIYLTIWTDPDLMDELRDSDYSLSVILKADQEFVRRMAER